MIYDAGRIYFLASMYNHREEIPKIPGTKIPVHPPLFPVFPVSIPEIPQNTEKYRKYKVPAALRSLSIHLYTLEHY